MQAIKRFEPAQQVISTWQRRFDMALGFRNLGDGKLRNKPARYAGMSIACCLYQPADIHLLAKCLQEYVQIPSIKATTSREFRDAVEQCIQSYRNGGTEWFLDTLDKIDYLLPGQKQGQPVREFLQLNA